MKKLGLDLGNRTVGIAISDELGFLARGIETYRFNEKDFENALQYIVKTIEQNKIDAVALGFPKNMDGSVGEQGQICLDFKSRLEETTNVKVVMWDERLTSKMASNMMIGQNLKRKKRKKDIDKMAAVIILQGYLDSIK